MKEKFVRANEAGLFQVALSDHKALETGRDPSFGMQCKKDKSGHWVIYMTVTDLLPNHPLSLHVTHGSDQ